MSYDKTKLNAFVCHLYDQKIAKGKHGHYETMFYVVHQAIKQVDQIIRNEVLEKLAGMELPSFENVQEWWDGGSDNYELMVKTVQDYARQAYAQGAASQLSAEPVSGQSCFDGVMQWTPCTTEHVGMVINASGEFKGYQVRYLYTLKEAK